MTETQIDPGDVMDIIEKAGNDCQVLAPKGWSNNRIAAELNRSAAHSEKSWVVVGDPVDIDGDTFRHEVTVELVD